MQGFDRFRVMAAAAAAGALAFSAAAAEWTLKSGARLRTDEISPNIVRVRLSADGVWRESGMNRYGFLPERLEEQGAARYTLAVDEASGRITFRSRVSAAAVTITPRIVGKGYAIGCSLKDGERIYGLGDSSRASVQRRPGRYEIWVGDRVCNLPIPQFMTSTGWGLLNNSTWRHTFDVGKEDPAAINITAEQGYVDFYLYTARDLKTLLDVYTRLTGRPQLLPVWAYGLTFVANQEINDFALCQDAHTFRKEGIPCDVIGLDPGWMSRDYDMTTKKFWDRKKFHIPYWTDDEGATFIGALSRMGFKLSLWTCCDYDLTRYEEECYRGEPELWKSFRTGTPKRHENDSYHWWPYKFVNEMDEEYFEEGVQPWFEHWKKFVKEGVRAFKLDGCNQYGAHPQRIWANGMSDREVHNLYPLIYARQMDRGYEEFAGRRAFINSASGFTGIQKFVATWAGDTGGGLPALMSCQCLGLSGHSNTSCDLWVTNAKALHYGFLQAWTFHDNWDCFLQPWYLGPKYEPIFRHYAALRYRLMPYLYSAAAEAHDTGVPMVRALVLEYPDHSEYDTVKGTYMLGHDLLVSAFDSETVVPPGTWYEWATGRKVVGPTLDRPYTNAVWSGGLYVRAGAVIPTWEGVDHMEKGWCEKVRLLVWPHDGDGDSRFELYEDEGNSLGYLQGECARTEIVHLTTAGVSEVKVGERRGSFAGMGKVDFETVDALKALSVKE